MGTFQAEFLAATTDGRLRSYHQTYSSALPGADLNVSTASMTHQVGQQTNFYIYEVYIQFDTSTVPDDAEVTGATLQIKPYSDYSSTDFEIQARLYDWGTGLTAGDWVDDFSSATLLATYNTATGWSSAAYISLASETAFKSSINATGSTRLIVVSKNTVDHTAPTQDEYVSFRAGEYTTNGAPKLIIDYTAPVSQSEAGSAGASFGGSAGSRRTRGLAGAATFAFGSYGLVNSVPEAGAADTAFAVSGSVGASLVQSGSGSLSVETSGSVQVIHNYLLSGATSFALSQVGAACCQYAELGSSSADFDSEDADVFQPSACLLADGGVSLGGEPWLAAVAHGADTFTAIGYIRTASRGRLNLGEKLPATDALGWIEPDVEAPDLLGLSITLGNFAIRRAQIRDLTIELSNEGGPVSATLSIASEPDRVPDLGSSLVVTYKGQTLFRGRLENIAIDVGDSTGYTLTYAGPLVVLRDHKAFRRVYVDSDLDSWRTDQSAQTSANVWEVRAL